MCAVGQMDRSFVPICVAGKSVACTIYNGQACLDSKLD